MPVRQGRKGDNDAGKSAWATRQRAISRKCKRHFRSQAQLPESRSLPKIPSSPPVFGISEERRMLLQNFTRALLRFRRSIKGRGKRGTSRQRSRGSKFFREDRKPRNRPEMLARAADRATFPRFPLVFLPRFSLFPPPPPPLLSFARASCLHGIARRFSRVIIRSRSDGGLLLAISSPETTNGDIDFH